MNFPQLFFFVWNDEIRLAYCIDTEDGHETRVLEMKEEFQSNEAGQQ